MGTLTGKTRAWMLLTCGLAGSCLPTLAAAEEIRVPSAGLTLIDAATVSAPDNGRFNHIAVRAGARVRAGDVLARLDSIEQELELQRVKTELRAARQRASNNVSVRIAKKELELADLEVQRAEELNRKYENTVSLSQMERLLLTRDRKKLEVERAEWELELAELAAEALDRDVDVAQWQLTRRTLTSPIDGIVVDVHHKVGEWVKAGDPLFRMLRVDRLQAEGYVPAEQLTTNLTGRPAIFLVQIPGAGQASYQGAVTFVSPEANPVNGVVKILADIVNRDGLLRAGYLGELVISSPPAVAPDSPSGPAGAPEEQHPDGCESEN